MRYYLIFLKAECWPPIDGFLDELFCELGRGDGDSRAVSLLLLWLLGCCSDDILANESRDAHESLELMSTFGESAESLEPIKEYFELLLFDILWCLRHLALLLLNHTWDQRQYKNILIYDLYMTFILNKNYTFIAKNGYKLKTIE